jgi:hypothetical protein
VRVSHPHRRQFPAFRVATALVFWPLYLPILLEGKRSERRSERSADQEPSDAMSAAIAQVQAELEMALASLEGWVEHMLAPETKRLRELGTAWQVQANRIREMDRLLARSEPADTEPPAATGLALNERCRQSELTRRANLDRLRQVRADAHENLMATLAWVRELVSMIHLAKFTGAPASRAEELVAQLAAAIGGISAVTWQDPPAEPAGGPAGPLSDQFVSIKEPIPCDSSDASATLSPRI